MKLSDCLELHAPKNRAKEITDEVVSRNKGQIAAIDAILKEYADSREKILAQVRAAYPSQPKPQGANDGEERRLQGSNADDRKVDEKVSSNKNVTSGVAGGDAVWGEGKTAKMNGYAETIKRAYMEGDIEIPDYMMALELMKRGDIESVAKIANTLVPTEGGQNLAATKTTKARGKADVRRLISMLGSQMYQGNLADVTIKEILQNSFDAVKTAIAGGKVKNGKIDIIFDPYKRIIAIRDNGSGMSKRTITDAFLTVAGTNKEGMAEGEASGGFGMAKAAFLYGNEEISVSTVNKGKRHSFKARGDELLDKDISILSEDVPGEESGTIISIKVPKKVTVNGEQRDVYFPWDADAVDVFKKPLIHDNIEVRVSSDSLSSGEVENLTAFNSSAWKNDGFEVIPVGKNFDLSGYSEPINTTFSWGRAEIYVGKSRVETAWKVAHNVLSAGVFQFNERIEKGRETVPYNVIINVFPTVKPDTATYPFDIKREGWKGVISEDIQALKDYVLSVAMGVEAQETVDNFKNIKSLPVVKVDDAGSTSLKVSDFLAPTRKEKSEKEVSVKTYKTVEILNGLATGITENGERSVVGKSDAAKRAEKSEKSFKAEKEAPKAKDFLLDVGIDDGNPIYHNNTSVDYVALAKENGMSAETFFAELGALMLKMKAIVTERGGYSYGSLAAEGSSNFVGISIDKGYYGVNTKVPFSGIMLNPLAVKSKSLPGLVMGYYETMVHEFTHVANRSHDQSFISAMADLNTKLAEDGTDLEMRVLLGRVVKKHKDLINLLRDKYDESTTKNTSKSLDKVEGGGAVASTRTQARPEKDVGRRDGNAPGDSAEGTEQGRNQGVPRGGKDSERNGLAKLSTASNQADTPAELRARLGKGYEALIESGKPKVTRETITKAFPGATVEDGESGFIVTTPNGLAVVVATDATISNPDAQGAFTPIGRDGLIQLAKQHDDLTVDHEVFHAAEEMVLTRGEIRALEKKYGDSEARAIAYSKWNGENDTLFAKIRNFFARIMNAFYPNATAIMADISSGRVWNREVGGYEVADGVFDVDDSFSVNYSVRTAEGSIKAIKEYNRKHNITDDKTIDKFAKDLRSVAAIILGKPSLDYAASTQYTSVKPNSDKHYVLSLDFSTICKKRIRLAATIEALQVKLGRGLTPEEIGKVREALKGNQIVVSCGACYVDASRIRFGLAVNRFLNNNKQYEPLREKFLTQSGMDDLAKNENQAYNEFLAYIRPQLIKISESRTEYRDELIDDGVVPDSMVKKFNSRSGMRWQSWSDFEVPHLIDAMQAIGHMHARGMYGHTYTKVPDMARVLGDTGMMINLSLIPEGSGVKNGRLNFSPVEGMPFEEMVKLRNDFPLTAGSIAIGVNDDHIRMMMASDLIDYIIPYHSSGLPAVIKNREGMSEWDDYTSTQNESVADAAKLKKHGTIEEFQEWSGQVGKWWNPNLTGDENSKVYLDKARAWGIKPKFEQFSGEPGYWKMLIDRKMYDNEGNSIVQGVVRPEFDMKVVAGMLDKYVPEAADADTETVDKLARTLPKDLPESSMMTGTQISLDRQNTMLGTAPDKLTKQQEKTVNSIHRKIINGIAGRRKVAAGTAISQLSKQEKTGFKYLFEIDKLATAFPEKTRRLLKLIQKYDGYSDRRLKKVTPVDAVAVTQFSITPEQARTTNVKTSLPKTPEFADAAENTPTAKITKEGLFIDVVRYQNEDQEGNISIRTGVFYLPAESKDIKHYRGAKNGYGGVSKQSGTTLIKRPIFVKGATGGKAPETAYDQIKGKGSYEKARSEILSKVLGYNMSEGRKVKGVQKVLVKYNRMDDTDAYDMAYEIVRNSKKGNTLAYAVQENIVAHAVRNKGFDAVIGYSKRRDGSHFISEIFDVRETTYPMEGEESDIHELFLREKGKAKLSRTSPTAGSTVAAGKEELAGQYDPNLVTIVQSENELPDGAISLQVSKTDSSSLEPIGNKLIADAQPDGGLSKRETFLRTLDDIIKRGKGFDMGVTLPDSGDAQSPSTNPIREGVIRDIKSLRDIIATEAFGKEGFGGLDTETQGLVLKSMVNVVNDLKISDSVVEFIPVNMVNILTWGKGSPQMALHNKAVLHDAFSVGGNPSVPQEESASALMHIVALLGAEKLFSGRSGDGRRLSVNRDSASGTAKGRHGSLQEVDYLKSIIPHTFDNVKFKSRTYVRQQTAIQGAFLPGHDKIFLVADGIATGEWRSVLQHEGFHRAMASGQYQAELDQLARMEKQFTSGNSIPAKWFAEARAAAQVDKGTPGYIEEIGAYAVSQYQEAPNIIRRWVDRLLAKVRLALRGIGIKTKLTPSMLREIAIRGLQAKRGENAGLGVVYSQVQAAKAIFSKLQQVSNIHFTGMKAQGVLNFLNKQGVKKAEIEATGLDSWLAGMKPTDKVSRDDLMNFVQANMVEVEDVVLDDGTQWTADEAREFHELDRRRFPATEDGLNAEEVRRYGELATKLRQSQEEKKTHFSQYTEPNADPGSYREMFVTAELPVPMATSLPDGYEIGTDSQGNPDKPWHILPPGQTHARPFAGRHASKEAAIKAAIELINYNNNKNRSTWQDGHSQYSDIQNPIVRVRYNTETRDGKTYLRIEEMQGPSDANQQKMPAYLRENIYNIGSKRIIAMAKEMGVDGIVFAQKPGRSAGETQADRYSLEKHVKEIRWVEIVRDDESKDGKARYAIGYTTLQGERNGRGAVYLAEELEGVIGKDLARKIIESPDSSGKFEGDDLRLHGGHGLKRLYDTQLPAMLESYAKSKFTDGILPITDNTPGSFPLFSRKASEQTPDSAGFIAENVRTDEPRVKRTLADLNFLEKIFSSFEYYAKKAPAALRIFNVTQTRMKDKVTLEKKILGDFIEKVGTGMKENKGDAEKAFGYILDTDRTGKGFSIKRMGGFRITSPEGDVVGYADTDEQSYAVAGEANKLWEKQNKGQVRGVDAYLRERGEWWSSIDRDGNEIATHDNDTDAVKSIGQAEQEYLQKEGFSEQARAMVRSYRDMTNRAFDEQIAELRAVLQTARENKLDEPTVDYVDETRRWAVFEKGKKIAEFGREQDAKKYGGGKHTYRRMEDSEIRKVLTLTEVIDQMSDLRGTYFARQRPRGEIIMRAVKGDHKIMEKFDFFMVENKYVNANTGEEFNRPLTDALKKYFNFSTKFIPGSMARRMQQLKNQGYSISVERETKMPESVFEATKLIASMEALLSSGASNAEQNGDRALAESFKIVTQSIADIVKERGYLSSRLKRSEEYWEGFETDVLLSGVQYAKGLAAGVAKRRAAQQFIRALTGTDKTFKDWQKDNEEGTYQEYLAFVQDRRLDPEAQPQLYSDALSFIEDNLRNEQRVDRVIGTLQGLATIKFLGLRVSSAAVNATNMVQAVPATISGLAGGNISEALGNVSKAAAQYYRYRRNPESLSAENREIFQTIVNNGWDEAQFNKEAMSVIQGKWGRAWSSFAEFSMKMFGAVEKANRATTIFASYKQLRANTKLTHEEAMEQAKHISDRAHGIYGKASRPTWARGAWNPLRLPFTFAKFGQNYALNMIDLGLDGKYKQAAYMLISPAIMAGAGATVLTPVISGIASAFGVGGDDPEEEFYSWVEEVFGSDRIARHGLAGLVGINIKGSIQMNNPMPTKLSELAGAPGAVIGDTYKGLRLLGGGELSKGAEALLPTAIGTMFKAVREYDEGITTGSYAPVFYGTEPIKADGMEATIRFFGFNPSSISGIREKQYSEKKIAAAYNDRRDEVYNLARRVYLFKTGDKMELAREISRYNELVRGTGRKDIPLITSRSIREMLKRAKKPSKTERLRSREMQADL